MKADPISEDPPTAVELAPGCYLLGTSVGSKDCVKAFMEERVLEVQWDIKKLKTHIPDLQIRL